MNRNGPNKTIMCVTLSLAFASWLFASPAKAEENQLVNEAIQQTNSISNLYSNAELGLSLATKPNIENCETQACQAENAAFDARVVALGSALEIVAFDQMPTLKKRISNFDFIIANKKQLGTTSSAAGKIVIFRGLQQLDLTDEALSFLIAREMGHVIAKHHNKNVATKLIITAIASAVFPALAIVSASSTAQQASTATTLMTSAASSATSLVGGEIALHNMKPTQIIEADDIGLNLMDKMNAQNQLATPIHWEIAEVAAILHYDMENLTPELGSTWTKDLTKTAAYLTEKAKQQLALMNELSYQTAALE